MAAFALTAAALAAEQPLFGHPAMIASHTDGPFRAVLAADGSLQLGQAMSVFHRGEAFGWASTFCVAPEAGLLLSVRLVSVADGTVVLTRERAVAADARGCGSARWQVTLPADLPPGPYQLQRSLLAAAADGSAAAAGRVHALPPIALQVLP